ncbi:MAG TPA: DnaJ domain-containing protein [Kofleriaceae bacterium]|nr:DnaJ domain-containing protein [Kofleriaceae bacterium]
MAAAALSIKLRCASWQQLATIYRRDLTRGSMFLKATNQPPIGTLVRIDLELPSASVIELSGVIVKHVVDPQRGSGVDLKLEPLPTSSVWLIESALAAETKVRAQSAGIAEAASPTSTGPVATVTEGEDVAEAETELVRALEAEVESLRKLNPFLVLGVGYETTDADVRAAFGELTKRYHPDRFARYQSQKLRQIAAEIFILIRDAYRKLIDDKSRAVVLAGIAPKQLPRAASDPGTPRPRVATPAKGIPTIARTDRVAVPPIPTPRPPTPVPVAAEDQKKHDAPTNPGQYDAPTNPSGKSAELAHTELAKADQLAVPVAQVDRKSGPVRTIPAAVQNDPKPRPPAVTVPMAGNRPANVPSMPEPAAEGETAALEALIEDGKLEEALAGFRGLAKKNPQDRTYRAGIELCEGLKALVQRDRLEAAQRFEAALELDPSNERAARELADMRRQATNERKGLLSRLMGKKEPPP